MTKGFIALLLVAAIGLSLAPLGTSSGKNSQPETSLSVIPGTANSSAEARLIEIYRLTGAGRAREAVDKAEHLVGDHPNFQLAQLVYGDLLAARGVARDVLVDSLRAIYRELGDGLPATRALLDRSLDVLKDQP